MQCKLEIIGLPNNQMTAGESPVIFSQNLKSTFLSILFTQYGSMVSYRQFTCYVMFSNFHRVIIMYVSIILH